MFDMLCFFVNKNGVLIVRVCVLLGVFDGVSCCQLENK